jgi:hypothetical protein
MTDSPGWIKSSFSNGNGGANCVEVKFQKSSFSGPNGACVEVGQDDDRILVRDSKANGEGPVLTFTRDEWTAFLNGVTAGEFNDL